VRSLPAADVLSGALQIGSGCWRVRCPPRRAIKKGDADAVADLRAHVPGNSDPSTTKLADAQLALACSYGVASWPRLVAACDVIDAIWSDDLQRLRALVVKRPALIREMARGVESCNWGPPMSYAANLGRDNIIKIGKP
jgi:hypothetical protein